MEENKENEFLAKEYLIKRKVLLTMSYIVGSLLAFEGISKYLYTGATLGWDMLIYMFVPWTNIGIYMCVKYISFNKTAMINNIIYHLLTYVDLLIKKNYISTVITFLGHFNMRVFIIDNPLLVNGDAILILICIFMTFYRMLTELFDSEGDCILTYDHLSADISEATSRVIMYFLGAWFDSYLTSKKVKCLKELQKVIVIQSKEKERFFAAISHELRNPLNSLLACVEVLPKTATSKQGELLLIAKICGETLTHLIGNILDVDKIRDGKMELNPTNVDIRELIDKTMRMHEVKAANKGLFFDFVGDDAIPPCVRIDKEKLIQVLNNLISNSIKFTQKGMVVTKLSWIPIIKDISSSLDFEVAIEWALQESSREDVLNVIEEAPKDLIHKKRESLHISRQLSSYIIHTKSLGMLGVPLLPLKLYSCTQNDSESASSEVILSTKLRTRRQKTQQLRSVNTKCQGILKIEVIDTGIGISDRNIQKLFQPYIQADNTISQDFGGTGLGLWISNNIIELMGGKIKIESELRHGSNFMVVLPLVSGSEERLFKGENDESNESISFKGMFEDFKGMEILYVDDIKENHIVMKLMLKNFGFKVHTASNGAEGLDIFLAKGIGYFNLIITDLRMPIMSGQTMIMKIREKEETMKIEEDKRTLIMVITGEPSQNERNKCLNILKANSFLIKPINHENLHREIQNLFALEEEKKEEDYPLSLTKKILVVEDDKFINSIILQFLSDYQVIQAYSVKEGIDKFKENYYDIFSVYLDGHLEDGSGRDFLVKARKFESDIKGGGNVKYKPVVSANGDPVEKMKNIYRNLYVQEYIQKPFTEQVLIQAIEAD